MQELKPGRQGLSHCACLDVLGVALPLPFLFWHVVFRAMSFRRRPDPSVSFFNTHSSLDQDGTRNSIAPTTITEISARESTKLIEVEIERKEEKAMVCGVAVHMITCVAEHEALRRFRHGGFFGRVFHRQRVGSFFLSIDEAVEKRWIRSTEW